MERKTLSRVKRRKHWSDVYAGKSPTEVSWYRAQLTVSLELIKLAGITRYSRVIDVGGGASTLVDDLLREGFQDITVLDIAAAALERAQERLGERAKRVSWIAGDVTQAGLPPIYDLWHDRAVFHFLTSNFDRRAYLAAVERALVPGGHLIIATFGLSGPPRCSGLEVVRYSPSSLWEAVGEQYVLVRDVAETHVTPRGAAQDFIYCLFKKGHAPGGSA
ncbi:MAG: class I SAM-dependent methyltransferase [Truepera sp.]|nr:class I SAM-dependent methyltransferase [Truepera sp.]